jgi:hypothetical protein
VRTRSAQVEKHLREERENMEEARRRLKVLAGKYFLFKTIKYRESELGISDKSSEKR